MCIDFKNGIYNDKYLFIYKSPPKNSFDLFKFVQKYINNKNKQK